MAPFYTNPYSHPVTHLRRNPYAYPRSLSDLINNMLIFIVFKKIVRNINLLKIN
jgi:hypothetical protein